MFHRHVQDIVQGRDLQFIRILVGGMIDGVVKTQKVFLALKYLQKQTVLVVLP